jgi:hypothetical protein
MPLINFIDTSYSAILSFIFSIITIESIHITLEVNLRAKLSDVVAKPFFRSHRLTAALPVLL